MRTVETGVPASDLIRLDDGLFAVLPPRLSSVELGQFSLAILSTTHDCAEPQNETNTLNNALGKILQTTDSLRIKLQAWVKEVILNFRMPVKAGINSQDTPTEAKPPQDENTDIDWYVLRRASDAISYLPENERVPLRNKIKAIYLGALKTIDFTNTNQGTDFESIVGLIQNMPEKDRAFFIGEGLDNPDLYMPIKKYYAYCISSIPNESEQAELQEKVYAVVAQAQEHQTLRWMQPSAASMIPFTPQHKRKELMERVFSKQSDFLASVKFTVVKQIGSMPAEEQVPLIMAALKDTIMTWYYRQFAVICIPNAPINKRASLLMQLIQADDKDATVLRNAAKKILPFIPECDLDAIHNVTYEIVVKKLNSSNVRQLDDHDARCTVALLAFAAPRINAALVERVLQTITDELAIGDLVELIPNIPEHERASVIIAVFNSASVNFSSKIKTLRYTHTLPPSEQEVVKKAVHPYIDDSNFMAAIFRNILDDSFRKELIDSGLESRLHQQSIEGLVVPFEKTGTKTYILPKEYEQSVRVIPLFAYNAWLAAYTAAEAWREAGFNYIPVEPIVGVHNEFYDYDRVVVTTYNLRGKSINDSIDKYTPDIQRQIRTDQEKIMQVLNDMSITHGHAHDDNFVLVPQTMIDADGNKVGDFSKMPRIYMIDFDMATS